MKQFVTLEYGSSRVRSHVHAVFFTSPFAKSLDYVPFSDTYSE